MNAPPVAIVRMRCCGGHATAIMDGSNVKASCLHRSRCRTQHNPVAKRHVEDAILEHLAGFVFVSDYFVGDLPVRHRYVQVVA